MRELKQLSLTRITPLSGRTLPRVRELKRGGVPKTGTFRTRRTLPRVRELKLYLHIVQTESTDSRTLPRVRELKQTLLVSSHLRYPSHPSQGA